MTNEEVEPCPRLCGNCARFSVLDDQPGDPRKWFGICKADLRETWPVDVLDVDATLDFAYDHGRHGDDDCEKPEEWFEEG